MPRQLNPSDLLFRLAGIVLCVVLSTVLAALFHDFNVNAPYLSFLPAVALCCLYGGTSAGVAAALLGGFSLWYFFLPPDGFALPTLKDAAHVAVFLAVSSFTCWIITLLRRANQQLVQENFELGYKVGLMREIRAGRETAGR